MEAMDLTDLYSTYERINTVSPRTLLKIVLYSYMNGDYSSRSMELNCKRDINFMYLLEGNQFLTMPLLPVSEVFILLRVRNEFSLKCLIFFTNLEKFSGESIFIDGTKIETCANKYTFVWKKAVTKNQAKLLIKIVDLIAECGQLYGIRIVHGDTVKMKHVKRLRKKLYALKQDENIVFVHGIGKRKTQLQKSIETLEEYLNRLKGYTKNFIFVGKETVILKQIRMQLL